MPRRAFSSFACSLSRALDVMGDTWTPLILRDVHLGVDRFDDIVRDLGIPRALLSARLAALSDSGLIDPVPYSDKPARHRYELTASGHDLMPALIALTQWGDRWLSPDGPPIAFRHECGAILRAEVCCAACGAAVTDDALEALPGPGGRAQVGTLVVAERLLAARS